MLGATDKTFDAIAGSKDTLRRVVRGVKLLQERGVRVKLFSLMMDLNLAEREQMVELVAELGVDYEQGSRFQPPTMAAARRPSISWIADKSRT